MRAGARWCNIATGFCPWSLCAAVLEPHAPDPGQPPDPVQVVVFNDGDSSVGMVVDEILDVTEEAVTVRQESGRNGLLGSAVVGKQVTDFLDLHEVIRAGGGNWSQGAHGHAGGQRILVADGSGFSRGMVRSGLDMAGYVVLEAANLDEVVGRLEQQTVDIVLAALDLPAEWQFRSAWPPCAVGRSGRRFLSWLWLTRPSRRKPQPPGRRALRIARRSSTACRCSNRWPGWSSALAFRSPLVAAGTGVETITNGN